MFVGARLRRLRDDTGLSQAALARRIDLSTSYVNQLENDQRPITVPVLLTLTREFGLDADYFAPDGDARLVADLSDVLASHSDSADVSRAEIAELVARMPGVGRTLVGLHRRVAAADAELEGYRARLTGDAAAPATPMPFEEVRDFFYDRRNHVAPLDEAAEQMFDRHELKVGGLDLQLAELLRTEFGISVSIDHAPDPVTAARTPKRRYDADAGVVHLAGRLTSGQRAFQLATQLAFLTQGPVIDALVDAAENLHPDSRPVARVGLANYFAGALLLPYDRFLRAAENTRYDIELLGLTFDVGFETICHRLSTLQRRDHRGVPFILVRTDRAGNISKRQSATAFHFSRVGGSCPLWVVHDAFATPGRIVTQVSQMPDGRSYFWLARTTEDHHGFLSPRKSFAIGLGCDIAHADRLVYAAGIDLADPSTTVAIGAGCKVCSRPACPQRAFPQLGHPIQVDAATSDSIPYRQVPEGGLPYTI
ncbi:short-chain fatty acyl-CoA regulator family protein [Gordonia sp. ABSL1-1]|uniref:short-chain fatty acyl-CoA regulator family protein n=1 Tax=Gordonia sp. ABSL1-1 TaxID=3053923 RepID=UPI00257322E1|nr:short-chain fatty acyl-CoA regulator family protein [Gordonia sp. ABSL1-1]MDL9937120.1 short-chain fatty acyl-CoA regulator family protein [Gordonia sp. ABSL1-1]